jgi:AhpC/TSA family
MVEPTDGCVKPAGGPLGVSAGKAPTASSSAPLAEEVVQKVIARVGHPAPDFEASAYIDGGFKNIKLSDYKGKWVALCFYPGDFTFV